MSLQKLIIDAETSPGKVAFSPSTPRGAPLTSEAPSLEEVDDTKQSFRECLLDIFKLNVD